MFIRNFGLFWRSDEVDWTPGQGTKGAFQLLGRNGMNCPGVRLADFRRQQGIYILYGNHGPYYVGLTKELGLGQRLKDHLTDKHSEKWDRFSWFGFRAVLKKTDADGLCKLRELASVTVGDPKEIISDVEAMLIRSMGLSNIKQMNFSNAEEWMQVKLDEKDKYKAKIK